MTDPRAAVVAEGTAPETFASFYERTKSVAVRITGDAEMSGAACEAAYLERHRAGGDPFSESGLLTAVRSHAIRISRERRPPLQRSEAADSSYTQVTALKAGLEALDPLGRRAIELAYFGGIGVTEVADIVGRPIPEVRAALRTALLHLGSLVRAQQENGS
jgi:DNA-directed RNA polymerase specialized sigma24 family protein